MLTWVLALSRLTTAWRSWRPVRCSAGRRAGACSSCAWSPAMTPSTCLICASIARLSRTNRTSPCLTRAPSSNCTAMISLSTRGLIATLAIGVTVPSASSRTGTDFLTALATVTRHRRAGRRAAPAPQPSATTSRSRKIRRSPQGRAPQPPPQPTFVSSCRRCRPGSNAGVPHSLCRRGGFGPVSPSSTASSSTLRARLARSVQPVRTPGTRICVQILLAVREVGHVG